MAKLRLRAAAKADLEGIDEYSVAQFGSDVAIRYLHGFTEAFALLREHPLSGRKTPEYGVGFRCLGHRRHRIFYQIEGDVVVIVRILHHLMDAVRVLREGGR